MAVLDDARTYIGARFGANYRAWELLSSDDQSRTLVSATSYIDSFAWVGTATGVVGSTPTFLEWPRSGISGVDPSTVPTEIVEATFELAVMIMVDADLPNARDQGTNVQSLGAGPARISFFRTTSAADGTATVLPPLINRMIGQWLVSSSGTTGGFASGTNPCSGFGACCTCNTTPCCCHRGRRDVVWPV